MILYAEDDPLIAKMICLVLQQGGFECALAEDGAQAVEMAQTLSPELIILDIVMPGMDGMQACEKIRQIEKLDDTPIIFLTSNRDEESMLKGYELGAVDYLTKDFSPEVLLAKIRVVLTRYKSTRALRVGDLQKGYTIDNRYKILREIGRGGMGVVYLVEDAQEGTELALKALHSPEEEPEKARERFRREIEVVARLRHPNLIRLHDSGTIPPIHYYTMDHLPGPSLEALLDTEGTLDPRRALEIIAKVAEGLQFAHDHGILHRDLKPDNILFTDSGEPVLTDFGLVLELGNSTQVQRLTQAGILLGTPQYMSPEQIYSPGEIDGRSDVYSLGVVLYRMLTSRTPFEDLGDQQALIAIGSLSVPPPTRFAPEIPSDVEELIFRALHRTRDWRIASAKDLATQARECLADL